MNRCLVIGLVACSGRTQPVEPPHNQGAALQVLVERANRELGSSWALDYHRPFAQPEVVSPAAADFLDACRAGDHPSCWHALWLGERTTAPKLVESNCVAGDRRSCRALPSYESNLTFAAAPGAAGRSEACRTADAECDRAALERECAEGFGASCHAWRFLHPPDLAALEARELTIVVEGCRDGLIDECKALEVTNASDETRAIAHEQVCKLTHEQCAMVAKDYERSGALSRARDVLERTCQYAADELATCLELADGYRTAKYPEPVPGRGTALRDWACPRLPRVALEHNTFPICKP